jgi:SnoaL-like domain
MFGHPGAGFVATSHHNANVLVTFEDDDRASVRTSLHAWHKMADGTTPQLWDYYRRRRRAELWALADRDPPASGARPRRLGIEWHRAERPPVP